jgi:hypothetical protein
MDILKNRKTKRFIGIFIVLVAIGFLALEVIQRFDDIKSLFRESNKIFLLVILGVQCVSFLASAWMSNLLLRFVGVKTSFKNNLEVAVINEFGSNIMPIAGSSITTYITYKKIGLTTSTIIFLETAWAGLLLAQYSLFFALSVLIIPHTYISLIPKIALMVLILGAIAIATFWFSIFKNKEVRLIHKIIIILVRLVKFILPVSFDEFEIEKKIEEGTSKISENFSLFFSRKGRATGVFLLCSIYFIVDISMLALAFLTFGYYISLPLVTFGLLLSLLLSLVTLFPGQPGVTEASFVLIFNAFGVPIHTAILATLLYRAVSYWIWIPLGIYLTFAKKKIAK